MLEIKQKTFLPTSSMGRHKVRSNQTKGEVRFINSGKLGRANSQSNLFEPECGKELQPLKANRVRRNIRK